MPTQSIPNADLQYALLSFGDNGKERTDDPEGGVFSRTIIDRAKQVNPSDIFLFAHGWKGDMPSAIDQFDRWIGAMWRLEADRAAMGQNFRPMFIGLHWPSQPWGKETITSSSQAAGSFDPASRNGRRARARCGSYVSRRRKQVRGYARGAQFFARDL